MNNLSGKYPRLSLSMIVRNEAKYIAGCLESIKDIVDEIIVVDTGSTDNTVEIAKRYGAVVSSFPWCNDFAAARNESLRHCTGDWILYLDADERLQTPSSGRKAIQQLLADDSIAAYNIRIQSSAIEGDRTAFHTGLAPRLFRNDPATRFEGRVHEQVLQSLECRKGVIRNSELIIVHLGYEQDSKVMRDKCQRNISLLEAEIAEHPGKVHLSYQLGNTYLVLGEYQRAEELLLQSLESPALQKRQKAFIHALLGEAALKQGRALAAISYCEKSVEYAPAQRGSYWLLANAYSIIENYDAAASVLRAMIAEYDQRRTSSLEADIHISSEILYASLGECCTRNGDYGEAAAVVQHGIAIYPHSNKLLHRLSEAKAALQDPDASQQYAALNFQAQEARRAGQPLKALEYAKSAIALQPEKEKAYIEAVQISIGMNLDTEGVKIFEEAVSQGITSARFHKFGIEIYVRRADMPKAIDQANRLASYMPASAIESIMQHLLNLSSSMLHQEALDRT